MSDIEAVMRLCHGDSCVGCPGCRKDPADWMWQTEVTIDRSSLRVLTGLLDRYDDDAFVEYVKNGYGMYGVLVRWEDEDGEHVDPWWFADENHDELVPADFGREVRDA